MAPPELARDAPGADLLHPVEVDALAALRVETHAPFAHGGDRGRGELLHLAEPLQRDERLDAVAGARAVPDAVAPGLLVAQQALLAQVGDDERVRFLGRQPRVTLAGGLRHAALEADHGDLVEPVAPRDLEVVRIVTGRDLEGARADIGLDVLVADDRHLAPDERHDRAPADELAVARVAGVDGDRGIAEQRDRADGRDRDVAAADELVVDRVERVVHLDVLDLEVRDRRVADRAPVDHAVGAVEIPALVHLHEHEHDRLGVLVVHREALVVVVERAAELLELVDDRRARFLAPVPDAPHELLAPELLARQVHAREHALDDVLGRNARVVGAADPERLAALHAPQADDRVLHRAVERVAHVQRARDIGRRHGDHERLAGVVRLRVERLRLAPAGEHRRLDRGGVVARLGLEACAGGGIHLRGILGPASRPRGDDARQTPRARWKRSRVGLARFPDHPAVQTSQLRMLPDDSRW